MGSQIQKRSGKMDRSNKTTSTPIDMSSIPQRKTAVDLYSALGNTRNDLLHAGKRRSPQTAARLEKQIVKLCNRLDELLLPDDRNMADES
jgi:hypothetical protein